MPTKRISHEKAIRKNIIECSVWWFHIWISDKQVPVSVRIRRRLWVIARVRERAEHSQYRKTIIWITSKQSARCRIKYPLRRVISPIDLSACWRLDILRSWYEAPLSKWSAMMFISFVFVFFFSYAVAVATAADHDRLTQWTSARVQGNGIILSKKQSAWIMAIG